MTRTSSTALHAWPCTAFSYRVVAFPSAPLLEISIALDRGRLPDRAAEPDAFAAVQAQYDALAAWFAPDGEDAERPAVSVDTGAALMAGPAGNAANGQNLSAFLADFVTSAADWLRSQAGDPPRTTLAIATSPQRPREWSSDLHPLRVSLGISSSLETADTAIPPEPGMAAMLETAFDDYNGTGGALKVAFSENARAGEQDVWLCRWASGGTSIAIRPNETPVFWTLAPLSPTPLSATVDGKRYQDVDLHHWLSTFLAAMQAVPPAGDAERAARACVAASVARHVRPIWRFSGDMPNAAAAIATVAANLARDLSRPIGSVVQFPVVVQSSVGSDASPAAPWRIHGEITNAATGSPSLEIHTAGVPLTAGDPTIEIFVSGSDGASADLDLGFRATHLSSGDADLRLAIPAGLPVGALACPFPLAALPAPPIIRIAGRQDPPDSPPDLAKTWAFTLSLPAPAAPQDCLALAVRLNPKTRDEADTRMAPDARQMPLLAALARFMSEWPQLAPRIDDRAAIDRALELAEAVTRGLDQWEPAQTAHAAGDSDGALWSYTCDWDRDRRLLTLTGAPASGSPVWPSIAGYAQEPAEPGALSAVYRRDAAGDPATLDMTWHKLAARSIRRVAADARVERNQRMSSTGARVNPALVMSSAAVSTAVDRPPLVADSPLTFPPAPTLEAAVLAALKAVVAVPSDAHVTSDPVDAEARISVVYTFTIADTIRSRTPVLETRTPLTSGLAQPLAGQIAAHLRDWRASVSPQGAAPQFTMAIALFFLEPEGDPRPSARIDELILPIDDRPAWWG